MPHPFPKQLISFSAGNLRESLRGPQPFQLSFISRRPAHPAVSPSPGMREGAAALSTFLRIPATCAPRRFPLPGDARRGRSPFAFLPQAGACTPPRSDFSIRQRTKNGCSPMLHPSPKQLISFSAGNLRESLRGPQPSQLFFVSRRPARPAVPLPGDARRGRSPFAFLRIPATCAPRRSLFPRDARRGRSPFAFPSAGGGVYPAEERFFHPSAHKKRMKPNAPSVPETTYSFSAHSPAEYLRESLRGPQPFQLLSYPGDLRAGGGLFLCREIPFPGAKIDSFPFSRPEIRRILAKTGKLILSKFLTR